MKPQIPVEKTPLYAPTNAKHAITDRVPPFLKARYGRFHSQSCWPVFLQLLTGLWLLLGLTPLGLGSTIRANGHYLELLSPLGGFKPIAQPFLYLSDTEWILNKYSNPDIDTILRTRAEQGCTVIKITAVELNWGFTPPYDYYRPDFNGNRPFGDGNTNCTIFIEGWWSRLRDIVTMADSYGLWIELTIGGPGRRDGNPYQINTQDYAATAYEYGRKVGERFIDATNVIFNIGQDTGADTYPYAIPIPRGIGKPAWEAMAKGVADGYNGNNSGYPTDYDNVTQTFHPGWPDTPSYPGGNYPATHLSSSFWFHQATWEDFNAMQVGLPDIYERVTYDYGLTPIKPTVFIEGDYEATDASWTAQKIRLQAWHAMFAGAAGYTYGHKENADPLEDHPPNHPEHYIDDINAPGAAQMAHLKYFLEAHYWWRFVPNQSVFTPGQEGSGTLRHAAVKDSGGRECYVYYPPASSSAEIKLSSVNGNGVLNRYYVEVKWFNPKTGDEWTDPSGPYLYRANPPMNLTKTFSIPASNPPWEDGVLMLRNIGF